MKPLQQGDLDSLCSVYAVLNLINLNLGKKIDAPQASPIFDLILARIHAAQGGDLLKIISDGWEPEFLPSIFYFAKRGFEQVGSLEPVEDLKLTEKCLVYFESCTFSHYTIVETIDEGEASKRLKLFDSFGFDEAIQTGDTYKFQENTRFDDWCEENMKVLRVWKIAV